MPSPFLYHRPPPLSAMLYWDRALKDQCGICGPVVPLSPCQATRMRVTSSLGSVVIRQICRAPFGCCPQHDLDYAHGLCGHSLSGLDYTNGLVIAGSGEKVSHVQQG
ncbi:hypothetical protein JZ751_001565 [Albula glossodonta]|uniref:Uncharacterized protein n=1 Tax=Albula glossodonta TaxID=121402 RepID=A0A8T2PTR7_9TELE|nr:hypothetical protein JZ751_001565 [Albula glossodonta]